MTPEQEIEKVKRQIKIFGLKKTHVAARCAIAQSELSHYLSGRRDLTSEKKTRLFNYLGVNT